MRHPVSSWSSPKQLRQNLKEDKLTKIEQTIYNNSKYVKGLTTSVFFWQFVWLELNFKTYLHQRVFDVHLFKYALNYLNVKINYHSLTITKSNCLLKVYLTVFVMWKRKNLNFLPDIKRHKANFWLPKIFNLQQNFNGVADRTPTPFGLCGFYP